MQLVDLGSLVVLNCPEKAKKSKRSSDQNTNMDGVADIIWQTVDWVQCASVDNKQKIILSLVK